VLYPMCARSSAATAPGIDGRVLRKVPDRLESMLTRAGVEHEIKVYPDAGHGFLNDHDPTELPVWVKGIAKLVAAEYHEPSARDARRRIIDFFDVHLKS
jgi:carboxymethylenebutenolidase